ncbi:hypothetical protein VTO73DRAFT_14413 [Trametes versicolor]
MSVCGSQAASSEQDSTTKFDFMNTSMSPEDVRDAVCKEIEMRHAAMLTLHEDIAQKTELWPTAVLNLHKEISQLWSIHNLVAPVNSLPPELLIMVFSLAGDDLVSVTHVCQHWRDVALHAPGLWTHVGHTSPEGVKTYLRRSKELPLDISLTVLEIPTVGTLRALTAEIHRTRSLRVTLPSSAGLRLVTQSLMSLSPQLEVLSIRDCGSPLGVLPPLPRAPSQGRPADFDGAPLLRSLTLNSVPLPYLSRGPSLLTNIELTGKECVGDALLVLDLLERSPSLERLKICGPFNHRGLVLDRRRTVSLPRLKRFEVRGRFPTGVGMFLASLVLPSQTGIMVHKEWSHARLQSPLADLVPAYNPGNVKLHSLQGLKRLELSWGYGYGGGLTLRAYRHSEDFLTPVLDLQVYGNEAPGERFLANWPVDASHLETLVICGGVDPNSRSVWDRGDHGITREQWAAMLASVPVLKRLRLMSVNGATLEGFALAMRPLAAEHVQLLCLQLEVLELFDVDPNADFWDAMKNVVMARATAAGGRLREVELFNTGSATWNAPDWSSLSKMGVRIIRDVDSDTEDTTETGEA